MSQISPSIPAPLDVNNRIKTFSREITKLKQKIKYILQDTFINSIEKQNASEIIAAFETVGDSLSELEKYLKEQEELKEEILVFKAKALEQLIKIISCIVRFQEMVDKLYPEKSKKIIDYLGYLLIALIASYIPILAIPCNIAMDSIKPYLYPENLTNILASWKENLKNLYIKLANEKDIGFEKKYEIAEQIAALSLKTKVSAVTLAELKLNIDQLKELNKKPEILNEIITSCNPHNQSIIMEILKSIEEKLYIIPTELLKKGKILRDNILTEISNARENFSQSFDSNKHIYERIESFCEGVNNLFTIKKEIQQVSKFTSKVQKIVHEVEELITHKIPKGKQKNPIFKSWADQTLKKPLPFLNLVIETTAKVPKLWGSKKTSRSTSPQLRKI